jgi:aminoglycoside 6'-N-acetyltransferase
MSPSVSFRPLERADFPLLTRWLAAPHVSRWWKEASDLASVEAKYGPRIDGQEPTHMFVIECGRRPIGWAQWYLWADYPEHAKRIGAPDASAGIDLAIGEADVIGIGLGPLIIRAFVTSVVFAHPGVSAVLSDPEERNRRSLRAFAKAGFRVVNTLRLHEDTGQRHIVCLDRPHASL